MSALEEIYKEYVNMRKHGLDSREATRALRGYIDPLPQRAKEHLASQFRRWEQKLAARNQAQQQQQQARQPKRPPQQPPQPQSQSQRPEPPAQPPIQNDAPPQEPLWIDSSAQAAPNTSSPHQETEQTSDNWDIPTDTYDWDGAIDTDPPVFDNSLPLSESKPLGTGWTGVLRAIPDDEDKGDTWVECVNCNRKNRLRDVFCYSCGHMLEDATQKVDTRQFSEATNDLYSDEYFGMDSVMVLSSRSGSDNIRFELRPQRHQKEIVVGRTSDTSTVRPDADLTEAGAAELGVSRLHLSVTHDAETETVQIRDLGSANGTFVNGQKVLPTERRVLRSGDELRLGRLVMRVKFSHPGQPL